MEVAVTGQRKTYTFLKRAKGTKRAAFLQQWAHAAPIAADSSLTRRTLNAVSYTGFVGLLFPFDGIEETWATSEASGHPAPTRYANLAVDEKHSLALNAIENVIIKGTARCKLVIATRRIKGISKYDYSRYCMSRHVEVIMKQTKFVS